MCSECLEIRGKTQLTSKTILFEKQPALIKHLTQCLITG